MMLNSSQKQQGIVLVVSLILLILITILSVSSMKNTVLEEKMAGNYKERNSAFQAAEAALRDAESYLFTTTILPSFDNSTSANTLGLYQPASSSEARWESVDWTSSSQVRTFSGALSNITTSPKYIIEELPPTPVPKSSIETGVAQENNYFRITSQAVGTAGTARVMLQSTYKR
jgi:type IV pilus assembly protein PilX